MNGLMKMVAWTCCSSLPWRNILVHGLTNRNKGVVALGSTKNPIRTQECIIKTVTPALSISISLLDTFPM
jgi:hypothetical protein